jgi:hypothetical protein
LSVSELAYTTLESTEEELCMDGSSEVHFSIYQIEVL